jgi:hypothetical protein
MTRKKRIKELENELSMARIQLAASRKKIEERDATITAVRKALGENGGYGFISYGGGGGGGRVIVQ